MKSAKAVGRPQGKRNSSEDKGGRKKLKPPRRKTTGTEITGRIVSYGITWKRADFQCRYTTCE